MLRVLGLIDITIATVLLVVALFLEAPARLVVMIVAIVMACGGTAAWVTGSRRHHGTP
jgi:hypothetical protein